jgi:hypothetical protein
MNHVNQTRKVDVLAFAAVFAFVAAVILGAI